MIKILQLQVPPPVRLGSMCGWYGHFVLCLSLFCLPGTQALAADWKEQTGSQGFYSPGFLKQAVGCLSPPPEGRASGQETFSYAYSFSLQVPVRFPSTCALRLALLTVPSLGPHSAHSLCKYFLHPTAAIDTTGMCYLLRT